MMVRHEDTEESLVKLYLHPFPMRSMYAVNMRVAFAIIDVDNINDPFSLVHTDSRYRNDGEFVGRPSKMV